MGVRGMSSDTALPLPLLLPQPQPELVALATALPHKIKFGTASWTVDGGADVYHRAVKLFK
jgi:hypothetical protein